MITCKSGKIIKINHDNIHVEIIPSESCKSCSGCMVKRKQVIVAAKTDDVFLGDSVKVGTKASDFLKTGFLLFILPVIGLFAGIAVTGYFFNSHSDWTYFAGGLIGLIIAFSGLNFFSRHISIKGTIVKE